MKKFNYLYLAGIACLASCSSDEFIGEQGYLEQNGEKEISFASNTPNVTRTPAANDHDKLGNQFNVYGVKGNGTNYSQVFNDYGLWYVEGSKSESNQKGWEYVTAAEVTPTSANNELDVEITRQKVNAGQTIKFWDYSANDYWFYAISAANGTSKENYTWYDNATTPKKADNTSTTYIKKCVVENVGEDNSVYYADAVHFIKSNTNGNVFAQHIVPNQTEGTSQEIVKFTFKRLQSKVRIGFYETVPGYAINDVKFHITGSAPTDKKYSKLTTDGDGLAVNLISASTDAATAGFQPTSTTYTITYDHNNNGAASLASGATSFATDKTFGQLNYTENKKLIDPTDGEYYMGETAQKATWAVKAANNTTTVNAGSPYTGSANNHYWYVLPNESQSASFKIKVDYTLTSLDGSKETIKVQGAEATVPADYCKWNANTAYTYLFKISDNTNGSTGTPGTDPAGLYPITFDACIEDVITGNQETITTVATPSITTYAEGSNVTSANYEYNAGEKIILNVEGITSTVTWQYIVSDAPITEQEAEVKDKTTTVTWLNSAITNTNELTVADDMKNKYIVVRLTYDTDKHAYKVIKIAAGS